MSIDAAAPFAVHVDDPIDGVVVVLVVVVVVAVCIAVHRECSELVFIVLLLIHLVILLQVLQILFHILILFLPLFISQQPLFLLPVDMLFTLYQIMIHFFHFQRVHISW